MRVLAAGVILCLAAAGSRAQEGPAKWIQDFEKKFPPVEKNAAAEELERLSLALGLDPYGESGDEHPAKEDLEAYRQAAVLSWLETQLRTSDDSIGAPPPRLSDFLDKRQATVWRVATLLGSDLPQWAFDSRETPRENREPLVVIALGRILLAAALIEERSGNHLQAGNLLEATWSLSRSVASQPDQVFQIIGVALGKLQAGVLRKMSEPAFDWTRRMQSDVLKEQMLESIESTPLLSRSASGGAVMGTMTEFWIRGLRAVSESVRKQSACAISHASSDEILKPADEELARWKDAGGDVELETIFGIEAPSFGSALHRVARLMVDRELTAKVLELRFEKAASRPSRWPEKFFDAESRICPGVTYEYRSSGAAMSLRFAGSVADAGTPLVLPLSFDARAPRPTPSPTPTRRPSTTPTPRPSLTPARAPA